MRLLLLFYLTVLLVFYSTAQPINKIKFSRSNQNFVFFKKGFQSDTIKENAQEYFYFVVPDSLKSQIFISVENGRLIKTTNDSLLKFEYLPGLKYETFFVITDSLKKELKPRHVIEKNAIRIELKTLINGVTEKPKVTVVIGVGKRTEADKLMLENTFYYKK